jgi:peptidoglycan biosynthesis protein MviN/MurJ (putative lipid II flippase)
MVSSIVGLVLNGILSYIFLRSFGYRGLLLGTSLSLGCEALIFLFLFHRGLQIEWSVVLRLLPQPLIATLLAVGGAIAVGSLLSSPLSKLLFMSVAGLGIYLLTILNPSYFDDRDWEFMREIKGKVMSTLLPAVEKD